MIVTHEYTIGPVNIGVHYMNVVPKDEPEHVREYRRRTKRINELECYVKKINAISEDYNNQDYRLVFKDNNGLEIRRNKHHLVFMFDTDDVSYVRLVDYNTDNNTCEILIGESYNISSLIKQPHLLETTQMQIILMQYLYSISGFLMHTSAVSIDKDRAFCFTGHSGAGKSTISALFESSGYSIITDETAIIWCEEDAAYISGTPWKGSSTYYYRKDIRRIDRIYAIEHGKANEIIRISMEQAINTLAKQTFPYFWDMKCIHKLMKVVARVLQSVDFGRYCFLPDESAVKYIIDVDNMNN